VKKFLSVRGKGAEPTSRLQFYTPEFPCKMRVNLWGKASKHLKRDVDVDCEHPLSLKEFSEELEVISEGFFNEFNDLIEKQTLVLELSGKHADAYELKNMIPSYGYDVFEIK
jgi:hypothetical protein